MKLGIVVQRYGERVMGGAETHSRFLAERLAARYDVTVLTTCAVDYRTWKNELAPGSEILNDVRIVRWPVEKKRNWHYFGWKSQRLFHSPHSILDEYRWLIDQGPACPGLIEYLRTHRNDFDIFLFFTYLYYPTFFGLPTVADKAILVPTAHDEPPIHFGIYASLFHLPRYIAFNTEEERQFVHTLFNNYSIPNAVIGVGVDLEQASTEDTGYLLYAGRIENGKNCEELFEITRRVDVPLKVIGHAQIHVPRHVEYLGFVSEKDKRKILAGCRALVMPSRNESLSLAVLEAWAHAKPVLVSAYSPVLSSHVMKSGGGYTYHDADDFREIIHNLDSTRGLQGRKYVEENYSWEKVLKKYEDIFSFLEDSNRPRAVSDATSKFHMAKKP